MWPELRLIVKLRIEARPWIDAGPHIQAGGLIHEFVLIQAGPSLVLSLICLSADKQTRLSTRLGPASNHKSSAVAEMGDHLATIDMGRKVGGAAVAVPLSVGELGPHLTNVAWAEAHVPPYQVAS